MYMISAVLKKDESTVALYEKEYRLLTKKGGADTDLATLFSELISENRIKISDVGYVGIAVENSLGSPDQIAADIENAKEYHKQWLNGRN